MMPTNLRDIRESAVECVRVDARHGNVDLSDDDAVETYCHESADGHHDVIYTYAVRELFANGDLDDYLHDVEPYTVVDQVLTVAAYYAVHQAFMDAVETVRGELVA